MPFMHGDDVLAALGPAVDVLFERHLATAKELFPHELLPAGGALDALDAHDGPWPTGVQSALLLNLLTEDNLPFYFAGLIAEFGKQRPWWDWVRRWTAEEMRHAIILRDYVTISHALDLRALERDRMAHVARADVPVVGEPIGAIVYLAIQELATRIAHRNTGDALHDDTGRLVMNRLATDENLHFLFYKDLVSRAVELFPSETVLAIDNQVRHFRMPGVGIPGFEEHKRAIADAGIFSAVTLTCDVFEPLVRRHWRVEALTSLSAEANRSRDRTLAFLDRISRIAGRLSEDEQLG